MKPEEGAPIGISYMQAKPLVDLRICNEVTRSLYGLRDHTQAKPPALGVGHPSRGLRVRGSDREGPRQAKGE